MAGSRPARDQREWIQQQERKDDQALRAVRRQVTGLKTAIVEGEVVPPVPVDSRTPTNPVELVYDTALYLGVTNRWLGRLIVDFPDVIKATDGSTIEVEVYELWGTKVQANYETAYPGTSYPDTMYPGSDKAFGDEPATTYTLMDISSESSFRTDDFTVGDQWRFRVRAVSKNGFYGLWSTQFSIFFLGDDTPPGQPVPPVAIARRGVISVTHNGMAVTGPMPADFKYMILAEGPASSPVTEVARWGRRGGQYVSTGVPYYEVRHFRARAVDESGNFGPWSESVIAYTTPLVDKDIIISELDAARTHLINIDAGVSILENSVIAEHLVATESMTAKFAQFLEVKADMIDVNSLWTDELFVGVADAVLVRSDMFEGKYFDGGVFRGTEFRTNVEEFRGLTWDEGGLSAYSAGGVRTVRIEASTGDLTATKGTLTGLTYQTHLAVDVGVKIDPTGFYQYDDQGRAAISLDGVSNRIAGTELRTSFTGESGVRISNSNAYGWPAITFISGNFAESLAPAVFGRYTIRQPMHIPELVLKAPSRTIVGGAPGLGLVRIEGDLRLSLGSDNVTDLIAEQPFKIEAWSPTDGWHYMGLKGALIDVYATDGNVTLSAPGGYVALPSTYDRTAGVSANLIIASDGGLFRSTSSRRYKANIRALSVDERLLDVPMVDWNDKLSQKEHARLSSKGGPLTKRDTDHLASIDLRRIPGSIAEDVVDAGGSDFVTYGPDGEVESLMYDRFALARTALLFDRIKSLEKVVARLQSGKTKH